MFYTNKNNMSKSIAKLIALMLCLIFITGFTYSNITDEVRNLVTEYYGGDTIPQTVLGAKTPQEIILALNDPYSEYITYQEFGELMDSINMEFSGIGVTVEQVPKGIMILLEIRRLSALRALQM